MKTLIICCGPPGSGKSTYSKSLTDFIRISQDDQGKKYYDLFLMHVETGIDIVIDRMNFNRKQRVKFINPAKKAGYKIIIKTFYVPKSVCFKRITERKDHPNINSEETGLKALDYFFSSFEKPSLNEGIDEIQEEYYRLNIRDMCIIVDLDGTLCNNDHRAKFVQESNGKKNWKEFFAGVADDKPNSWCIELIMAMKSSGYKLVFCTGRPEDYREVTEKWLSKHVPTNESSYKVFMRPKKDKREDSIIKEIILDFEIIPRYNVLLAIDDRDSVVKKWRERGITTLQCNYGNF